MSRAQTSKRDEIRKKEMMDRIVNVFRNDPDHKFSPDEIRKAFDQDSQMDTNTILRLLRHLIQQGCIRSFQMEDGSYRYRFVPENKWDNFSGLGEEEHRVFTAVEDSSHSGIWRADIKKKTGIEEKHLGNIIKDLIARELIREVKSVNSKKMYIAVGIEPSNEVTGGIFYNGAEFKTDLIEQIIPRVAMIVTKHSGISVRETRKKVKESGMGNLSYTDNEAERLVNAAISSGKIYKSKEALRPGPAHPINSPISRTPCKNCPLVDVCQPKDGYEPTDCVYLQKMTEFF